MRKVGLFQKWVGDLDELTGSRIQIAKKKLDNGNHVYAFALNELFDLTSEDKLLSFSPLVMRTRRNIIIDG